MAAAVEQLTYTAFPQQTLQSVGAAMRRIVIGVAVVLVWGWGSISPAKAGCGDHLHFLITADVERTAQSLPLIPAWPLPELPLPCSGPGCSQGPDIPFDVVVPPLSLEDGKSSALPVVFGTPIGTGLGIKSRWFITSELPEGFPSRIFHPPRSHE